MKQQPVVERPTIRTRNVGQERAKGAAEKLSVVTTLSCRYHRAVEREHGVMEAHQRTISEGMRIGWAQAIALILGADYGVVVAALREGKL